MIYLKTFIGIIFFLTLPDYVMAQSKNDIESKVVQASEYLENGKEEESLELFKEVLDEDENNEEALWNIAVIYAQMGNREEDEEIKKKHLEKALDYADKVLEHHGESGYAHYAKAVALARKTDIQGTDDRVDTSHEIKKHIEIAAEKLPEFAPVWHLYGVWHSDVANVSSAESAAVSLFSEGLPDADNEKAEEYLKKAIELSPNSILFNLDLANHFLEVDEKDEAKKYLEKVIRLEPKMKDDSRNKEKAEELLSEIN